MLQRAVISTQFSSVWGNLLFRRHEIRKRLRVQLVVGMGVGMMRNLSIEHTTRSTMRFACAAGCVFFAEVLNSCVQKSMDVFK
jgi:diacylglycerol kinase